MTQFTPGPWLYDGGAQIVHGTETHIRVAFLPSDHYKYDCSKANGRLIAASPTMYEALKFVSTDPCFKLLGSVTHDEVRAALAMVSEKDADR